IRQAGSGASFRRARLDALAGWRQDACSWPTENELNLLEASDPVAPESRAQKRRQASEGVDDTASESCEPERRRGKDRSLEIWLRKPCEAHPLECEVNADISALESGIEVVRKSHVEAVLVVSMG